MSRRFHLSPQQPKQNGTPLWIPILIGIVIGLGLGLLLNMMGIMRCCSYSTEQASSTAKAAPPIQVEERVSAANMNSNVDEEAVPEASEASVIDSMQLVNAVAEKSIELETEAAEPTSQATRDPEKPIRLQVLNGCGARGIARKIAPALRKLGFDVRESRNAKNFRHQTSKVYGRSGDISLAYLVANGVGIDSSEVAELPDEELVDIDVTIVIGADYKALNLGMNE